MSSLVDIRAEGEANLERILARLDERARRILRQAIRKYGRVQDVPQSVWDEIKQQHEDETVAALLLLMIAADGWTMGEIRDQGGRAIRLSTQRMSGYGIAAARKAAEIARQTTDTLRSRLETRIEDAKLDQRTGVGQLDLGDIDKALDDVLKKERRQGIATDATTGSISDGQRGAAGRVNEPGGLAETEVELVWETEGDEKVCPRCSPLNGTTEDVWGLVFPNGPGPEAHPNCRCQLRPRVRVKTEVAESYREAEGRWITLDGGQHVKIDDGETVADAIADLKGGDETPKEKPAADSDQPKATPIPKSAGVFKQKSKDGRYIWQMSEDDYIAAISGGAKADYVFDKTRAEVHYGGTKKAATFTGKDGKEYEIRKAGSNLYLYSVGQLKTADKKSAGKFNSQFDRKRVKSIGYIAREPKTTYLAVDPKYRGRGLGAELQYHYRLAKPFNASGGLSDDGERTARKTFRRIVAAVKSSGVTESVQADDEPLLDDDRDDVLIVADDDGEAEPVELVGVE